MPVYVTAGIDTKRSPNLAIAAYRNREDTLRPLALDYQVLRKTKRHKYRF